MGYKQNFGLSRASGNDKTEKVASQSSLFRLGSPINHNLASGGEHVHDGDSDKYSYQKAVTPSTNNQSGKSRRKLSKDIANAANTADKDNQTVNTQGYMRGGSSSSIKLFTKNNIIETKTGARGGGTATGTSFSDSSNQNINWRDVNSQLKETGSVTVKDGKISTGTSQTETAYGSVKRDNAISQKKAEKELKTTEAQAKRAALLKSRETQKTNNRAELEKRKAEISAKKQALINARETQKTNKKAELEKRRANDLAKKQALINARKK